MLHGLRCLGPVVARPRPLTSTLTLLCRGNGPTSNEPFVLSKVCFYFGHCEPITVRDRLMMPVVFTPGQVGLPSQSVSETLSTCSVLTSHLSGLSRCRSRGVTVYTCTFGIGVVLMKQQVPDQLRHV